jgi:hypothetical protein
VSDQWPVATHEAGHAVAAHLLRATRNAGPITIVADETTSGRCIAGRAERYPSAELSSIGLPYALMPARLRRWHETTVMSLLAGWIAEDMFADAARLPPLVQRDVKLTADQPLRRPEADMLALASRADLEAAARDEMRTDFTESWRLLVAMHRDETAAEQAGRFWTAEVRRMLSGDQARVMVRALAQELLTYGTLSAKDWRSVLAALR